MDHGIVFSNETIRKGVNSITDIPQILSIRFLYKNGTIIVLIIYVLCCNNRRTRGVAGLLVGLAWLVGYLVWAEHQKTDDDEMELNMKKDWQKRDTELTTKETNIAG